MRQKLSKSSSKNYLVGGWLAWSLAHAASEGRKLLVREGIIHVLDS